MAPATAPAATELLPAVNADGLPVVPMSDEQKYLFDLKGWITLPGLLEERRLERIRAHQMQFLYHPETLPPEERDNHGGPSQVLLDAPAVVGVLNEIISHQPLAAEDCYGFRFDHTYTSHRQAGHDNFNPPRRRRAVQLQRQLAPLPDAPGEGPRRPGTGGVGAEPGGRGRGRHAVPVRQPQERVRAARIALRPRQCVVGDLLLSARLGGDLYRGAVPHRGRGGSNTSRDRLSLFTCYNTVNAKWGKACPPPAVIAAMPPLRRTLFRGVWHGMREVPNINKYHDEANTGRFVD